MTVTVRARREFPVTQESGEGTRILAVGEEAEVSKTRAESLKKLGKATIVGSRASSEDKPKKSRKTGGRKKKAAAAEAPREEAPVEEKE
jgi:hypothetical protein